MAERVRFGAGTLELRGETGFLAAVRPRVEEAAREARREAGFAELAGVRVYRKLEPLRGKARWRHALRSLWPGIDVPRLQELENLRWLRRHGFGAPEPLAAGVLWHRGGWPVYQFLFTRAVADARTLRAIGEAGPAPLRRDALELLGREVARLHGEGFVHRDLYPRNVLVTEKGGAPRLHFLDAWRGGPRRGLRGPAWDLGCFLLFAPDLFPDDEVRLFLDSYFAEHVRLDHPVNRPRLVAAAARHRRRQWKRFARRRRPGSRLALPTATWNP